MTSTATYYDRICLATTRHEAADLIRAHATRFVMEVASHYSVEQRIARIEKAEQQAASLERDYEAEGSLVPESQHPWRQWLVSWGWPADGPVTCDSCGAQGYDCDPGFATDPDPDHVTEGLIMYPDADGRLLCQPCVGDEVEAAS